MHQPRQLGVWQWKLWAERLSAMFRRNSRKRTCSSSLSSCDRSKTAISSDKDDGGYIHARFVWKSVTITALISRSCSLLSHASGQATSASPLFTIVRVRQSLLINAQRVTMKTEVYTQHVFTALVFSWSDLQKAWKHSRSTAPSPGWMAEKQMGHSISVLFGISFCSSVAKNSV